MQHDVSEALSDSQNIILVGDFNAHLDKLPDRFSEGHVAMLSRFPELGTTRLGHCA
jgi:endonuclease/exonuclease/phosphatase (EEP) superfamily protein YafD